MGTNSKIHWLGKGGATWNPTYGCGGCELNLGHCYAARMCSRFPERYPGLVKAGRWTGKIQLAEDRLELPLRWKKPRRVFVDSMGDLFSKHIGADYWARIWEVMCKRSRHTFMILTKQPEQMFQVLRGSSPLKNVWIGVSVTDQKTADERIPLLLQTPAAVRFVSAEPLLGPVDFHWLWTPPDWRAKQNSVSHLESLRLLDLLIVGGESGPGARRMEDAWVRSLCDQCQEAKVPFFFKAWGAANKADGSGMLRANRDGLPVLDGRTWGEFPKGAA